MKKEKNAVFVPDDTPLPMIRDLSEKFEFLNSMDFTKISLADEIIKLNYEVVSRDYEEYYRKNNTSVLSSSSPCTAATAAARTTT